MDLGNIHRLPHLSKPTETELQILARHRHFHSVVKIRNNHASGRRSDFTKCQFRAHSILFRHEAPVVAAIGEMMTDLALGETASLQDLLTKTLTVELVGPKGEAEKICRNLKYQTHIQPRPHVIFQWYSILRICHPLYKEFPDLPIASYTRFRQSFEKMNQKIINQRIDIDNPEAVEADLAEGDDVAKVRSGILSACDAEQLSKDAHHNAQHGIHVPMEVSTSFISQVKSPAEIDPCDGEGSQPGSEAVLTHNQQCMEEYIRSAADAFNVQLGGDPKEKDGKDSSGAASLEKGAEPVVVQARREDKPLSEFDDMQELLTGAFPTIFILGNTYKTRKMLNPKQLQHLLLQFTNIPAENHQLQCYLFDCRSRHAVINHFAAKVRRDPAAFKQYSELVMDPSFQEQIRKAAKDSTSASAKNVLRTVLPVLSFGSGSNSTAITALGDSAKTAEAIACQKRRGGACSFTTITPDEPNNPTSFRLTCRSVDNVSFPSAVDDAFYDELRESGTYLGSGNVQVPLDYSSRVQAATRNPVAVALEFRTMVENIVEILIGCPLDYTSCERSKNVRTWYFKSKAKNSPHHKGVFGYVTAVYGSVETQARGALHFHIVIWGGITPKLLENSVGVPEVCKCVEEVLDTMYTAELPRAKHVEEILVRRMKNHPDGRAKLPPKSKQYAAMLHVPSPKYESQNWCSLCQYNIKRTGIHCHTFTCKKPPSGRHRCRGAMPQDNNERTGPLLLTVPENEELSLSEICPVISEENLDPVAPPKGRNYLHNPVPALDDRLIVWELKRSSLSALPAIPQALLPDNNQGENNTEEERQLCLDKAKQFCISQMVEALAEEANTPGYGEDGLDDSICDWLQGLLPQSVISVYNKLVEDIKSRNGWVVSTSPILHNATGSSTNAVLLGNSQQSKGSLFYVIPYLCKNKVELESCLFALERAREYVKEHPSQAGNSGTDTRFVQHMFTRVVNELSRSIELSSTQIALSLLDMGERITTDSFRYFGADYCMNFFMSHILELCEEQDSRPAAQASEARNISADSENESDSSDDDGSIASFDSDDLMVTPNDLPEPSVSSSKPDFSDFGRATFYRRPLDEDDIVCEDDPTHESVPVHIPTHWFYRGQSLRYLTAYEYAALVDIVPLSRVEDPCPDPSALPTETTIGDAKMSPAEKAAFESGSTHMMAGGVKEPGESSCSGY